MSAAAKKRNKNKQNRRKNPKNMQQRKRPHAKTSNNKSKKRAKTAGELETNLSWGIAVLLLCLIAFLFIYSQRNKQTIVFIEAEQENENIQSALRLKYDHSFTKHNKHLISSETDTTAPTPFLFKAKVLQQWGHNKNDFTQGLEVFGYDGNKLIVLESTGLYKQSKLKYVELELGDGGGTNVKRLKSLRDDYFGEGCTLYFDIATGMKYIYQLTWKKRKVIVYDLEFNEIKEIELPTEMKEGWGIYYDYNSGEFIATDGSTNIFFIEAERFIVTRQMSVKYMNNDREAKENKIISLRNLNEIEVVNGWILANVWYNTNIYVISPFNGFVYGIIECWDIFPVSIKGANHAVLNGIAFDSINNRLIITGKNWPNIFAIELPQFIMDKSRE